MIKGKIDEMEQWGQANLEDMQSRRRNDCEEEQTRGCFKATLRQKNGAVEKTFHEWFR